MTHGRARVGSVLDARRSVRGGWPVPVTDLAPARGHARRGPLGPFRTVNVPLQALVLIHPRHHDRFSFRQDGQERIGGRVVQKVGFAERTRPTIIRNDIGRDVASRGAVWIDPNTGAVWRTELRLGGDSRTNLFQTTVVVTYQQEPALDLLVPEEVEEVYAYDRTVTHARASYSSFRQFRSSARIVLPQ